MWRVWHSFSSRQHVGASIEACFTHTAGYQPSLTCQGIGPSMLGIGPTASPPTSGIPSMITCPSDAGMPGHPPQHACLSRAHVPKPPVHARA